MDQRRGRARAIHMFGAAIEPRDALEVTAGVITVSVEKASVILLVFAMGLRGTMLEVPYALVVSGDS
jgi:hypothetical protein